MVAKLENGVLYPCPQHGCDGGGRYHTNLPRFYEHNPDIAVQDGYYPVTHTDKPDGDYLPSWELQEVEGIMQIVQVWSPYTPEPEPADPITERFEFIEDCLLEISEKLWN